jgi:hypothetical protein
MQVVVPKEVLPELDTVAGPSVFYDEDDAYLCYIASERAGGGNVVLKFEDVIELRVTPLNVDGLKDCRYPVDPWTFNEVVDGEEAAEWKALSPRFWLITFRDVTVEILFATVSVVGRTERGPRPHNTLMSVLARSQRA